MSSFHKPVLLLSICILLTNELNSQDFMIVNDSYNGSTVYTESIHINTLSELPPLIELNLNGYLNRVLGDIKDSVSFSHGQMINLEKEFEKDSLTYLRNWVVPKYDLNFVIRDKSIGIQNYYIQIRLDQYGQILNSNWPTEHFDDRNKLKNRNQINDEAIAYAKAKGFYKNNFMIELRYRKHHDSLNWVYKFPLNKDETKLNFQDYYVIEIAWNSGEIVEDYNVTLTKSESH